MASLSLPALTVSCPEEDSILAFVEHRADRSLRRAICDHLDHCGACRDRVTALVRRARPGALERREAIADPGSPAPRRATVSTPSPREGSTEAHSGLLRRLLRPGEILASRFRVLRELGAGTIGVVYEAEDLRLGTIVALKLLWEDVTHRPQALRRMGREILLSRSVVHPNICRVHDLGASGTTFFVTMEFVRGHDLASLLRSGRPSLPVAIDVLCQICDGVDTAHRQGVIHRDLKPNNVMLDELGRVKITDLGLASEFAAGDRVSHGGVSAPAHWAPELIRGGVATVRSDIHAIGLIAVELLGGTGHTLAERLMAVPDAYRRIVDRCLRASPEARYGTVDELRRAIHGVRRQATAATALAVDISKIGKRRRGRSRLRAGGKAIAVALAAAAIAASLAALLFLLAPQLGMGLATLRSQTVAAGGAVDGADPHARGPADRRGSGAAERFVLPGGAERGALRLQPTALQPTALQPTALQPTALQPTALQPTADGPASPIPVAEATPRREAVDRDHGQRRRGRRRARRAAPSLDSSLAAGEPADGPTWPE